MRGAAALVLALFVAGCEPCLSGGCNEPRLHVEGRVVDPATGLSVSGAAVVLVAPSASSDSAMTMTDDRGLFSLTLSSVATGAVNYELRVAPPNSPGYAAPDQRCTVDRRTGNGCPLGVIVARLYFPGGGFIRFRGASETPIPDGRVTFRRTGGTPIYGPGVLADSDAVRLATEGNVGHINLFTATVFATQLRDLIGDMWVELPKPLDSAVVRDFHASPSLFFPSETPPAVVRVGPSLKYAFELVGASTAPVPGVTVRFTRSSGVVIETAGATAQSNAAGVAVLDPRPLTRGTVTGDVEVFGGDAGGITFTIRNVTLTTHDDDSVRVAGRWNVLTGGPAAPAPASTRK